MTVTLMMMVFTVTFCVFADFTTGGDGFDGGPWGGNHSDWSRLSDDGNDDDDDQHHDDTCKI